MEEALAGRAERIKAYSIATAVFGRSADFDPQMDPIVRIEAVRLRRAIERYYLRSGKTDSVVISIPRGTYAPQFTIAPVPPADLPVVMDAARSERREVTVLVQPFDADAAIAGLDRFGRGFTRHIIVALMHVESLLVFHAGEAPSGSGPAGATFVLSGGLALVDGMLAVDVLLSETATGRCLWGDTFRSSAEPEEMLRVRDRVAEAVVLALGQPYGALFDERLRALEAAGSATLTAYGCVLRFYRYWRRLERGGYASVRAGLEQAVEADPSHAEALACLSLMCTDAVRAGLRKQEGRPDRDEAARAMELARRAVALSPRLSIGHHALGLALWFGGHAAEAFAAFDEGMRVNPYDTDLMAELGLRLTFLGEWDRGVMLLQGAYAANPTQPSAYRIGLALWHYAMGRYFEAQCEIGRIDVPGAIHVAVLKAAAAAEGGDLAVAHDAVAEVLRIDRSYATRVEADLRARGVSGELVARVLASLAKAGLAAQARAPALQ